MFCIFRSKQTQEKTRSLQLNYWANFAINCSSNWQVSWYLQIFNSNSGYHGKVFSGQSEKNFELSQTFNHLNSNPTKWSNTLNNSSANCRRIVWVCLTILWNWRLKGLKWSNLPKTSTASVITYFCKSLHFMFGWVLNSPLMLVLVTYHSKQFSKGCQVSYRISNGNFC